MLDLGLSAGLEHLGIGHRTIAYCERDAYAASQLLALVADWRKRNNHAHS